MKTLREAVREAQQKRVAIGHFNISNTEGLWGVFRAAQSLSVPIIIGVSEGERDFIGVKQVASLVKSIREEFDYPIYLNADHTYSFERVKEAVSSGVKIFLTIVSSTAICAVAKGINNKTKSCNK